MKVYDLDLIRNMKKLIVQLEKPLITYHDYESVFGKVEENEIPPIPLL